jgi:hypothetical protein
MVHTYFNDITIETRVMGRLPPLLDHNLNIPVHHQLTVSYRERTDGSADSGPSDGLAALVCRMEQITGGDDFVESRATLSLASGIQ